MIFHEFGDKNFPHILLIHGGGNFWWNYLRQARILSDKYHVVLPTLNGHGEEYQKQYISTENSAQEIMNYIKHIWPAIDLKILSQIVKHRFYIFMVKKKWDALRNLQSYLKKYILIVPYMKLKTIIMDTYQHIYL